MSSVENTLSDEDYQLVDTHQLGAPLGIYKLNPRYINTIRRMSLLVLLLGIMFLIVALLITLTRWHQEQTGTFLAFLLTSSFPLASWLAGLSGLIGGLLGLYVMVPRVQSERLIICEQGLLQIKMETRSRRVEVVRWTDIQSINKELIFPLYSIVRRRGKVLTIGMYQGFDGLVALIKQRSGVA